MHARCRHAHVAAAHVSCDDASGGLHVHVLRHLAQGFRQMSHLLHHAGQLTLNLRCCHSMAAIAEGLHDTRSWDCVHRHAILEADD